MPEFGLAGAEIMCENLCYQLQKSGRYNVIVVSLFKYYSPITERLESAGIKILYLDKKSGLDFSLIFKLYKLMKKYSVTIVHTHRYVMQYAIPAAIMAGVKCKIHTIHNIATKEVDGYRRKLALFFFKKCNVRPVSISPLIQDTVVKEYGIYKEDTPIVYNGSDLNKCFEKKNYAISEPFRFLHIGRFNPQKNHGLIIEAAKVLASEGYNFVISLVGGAGNEKERMEEVSRKGLEDYVKFCGLQSDVYPFLQKCDCFILPSLYEGMPVTLVEAMGCGIPIIASAVGGIPDMLENEVSGLLINPTLNELVDAMKRVIENTCLREKIGKNAKDKSRRFSAENMFEGYDAIYQKNMK